MVEIETGSRITIWRTFGRIQWHVIPEPVPHCRVLPPGELSVRATVKILRRILCFLFVFLLQFWLRRAAALVLSGALAKEGVGGGVTHPPTVGRCRQFVGDGGTCSDTTL